MERMYIGEVEIKYPDKWIIAVNLGRDKPDDKLYGDIYMVTDSMDEALDKESELSTGGHGWDVEIWHNGKPVQCHIGGLWRV